MTSVPPTAYAISAPPPELPELPEGLDPTPMRPRWRPWTAWAALVAAFGAALLGALIVGIVAVVFGDDLDNPSSGVTIVATYIQDLALVGAAVVFARMAGPVRPWQLGLRRPRGVWSALGWIALAFLVFYLFSAAWVSLIDIKDRTKLPDELGTDNSTAALIGVTFLVTVMAPLAEETFFRGYFFVTLRNWRGVVPAAIVTGLVFGAIHLGSAPVGFLVPLAFFGMVLCFVYVRTRSLLPCYALHSINNSIAFGVAEGWDWQIPLVAVGALAAIALVVVVVRRIFGSAPAGAQLAWT